jgi:hypothetical protein
MSHSARPAQKAHSDHLPQSLKLCPHSDTENAFGLPEVLPHLSSSGPRPLPWGTSPAAPTCCLHFPTHVLSTSTQDS